MVMTPVKNFKAAFLPSLTTRFANEAALRDYRGEFAAYTAKAIHKLPLASAANRFRLSKARGRFRKDGNTPAESHEQRHIITANSLLNKHDFIIPAVVDKYGTADAFMTGIILHDIPEDRIASTVMLKRHLHHTNGHRNGKDRKQAFLIVDCLTRKAKTKHRSVRDRQMKQLLRHPYAFIIKQIDWCDKLATMIGVPHFEDNNMQGIIKVLEETARYFLDTNQRYAQRAMRTFPFARGAIKAMDNVMGLQYEILLRYVHAAPGNDGFKIRHPISSFDRFLPSTIQTLECVPRGVHYIHNMLDRIEAAGNPAHQEMLCEIKGKFSAIETSLQTRTVVVSRALTSATLI